MCAKYLRSTALHGNTNIALSLSFMQSCPTCHPPSSIHRANSYTPNVSGGVRFPLSQVYQCSAYEWHARAAAVHPLQRHACPQPCIWACGLQALARYALPILNIRLLSLVRVPRYHSLIQRLVVTPSVHDPLLIAANWGPGMQRPRDTLPVLVYILEVDGRALHRGHGDPEHRKLRVAVAGGGAQLAGLFGNKLVVGAVLRALDVLRHLAIAVHCVEVHQHCGNASEPIGLDLHLSLCQRVVVDCKALPRAVVPHVQPPNVAVRDRHNVRHALLNRPDHRVLRLVNESGRGRACVGLHARDIESGGAKL
mmetsp:Transcript_73018/g.123039  ORF Transcript_73018/g.123039 Transcript_73018/m.123039 type:complete len:309 (+) Transcript_73018:146-1072(+)